MSRILQSAQIYGLSLSGPAWSVACQGGIIGLNSRYFEERKELNGSLPLADTPTSLRVYLFPDPDFRVSLI